MRNNTLSFKSEKDFIDYIRIKYSPASENLLRTFGEDCAVIKISSKIPIVISCDDFIEGKHFLTNYLTLKEIGQKALLVNISDIIAMGAIPLYYLISLRLSYSFAKEKATEIYEGLYKISKSFNIKIIGGNTEVYDGPLSISITILGKPISKKLLYRNNAKVGDAVFLSKKTGFAALGLKLLQKGWHTINNKVYNNSNNIEENIFFRRAIKEYIRPSLPFRLSLELMKRNIPNAAIDISDGLISDLYEICKESNVSCVINKNKILPHPSLNMFCQKLGLDFFHLSLAGGDDYQIIFTVPKRKINMLNELKKRWKFSFIGEIIDDSSCSVIMKDGEKEEILPAALGYDQFRLSEFH